MDTTNRLQLPFIMPSQAQKHVTHNEALLKLDTLVQLCAIDDGLGAPPSSPSVGDTYIVAAGASGAWAGQAKSIAVFDGIGWQFMAPRKGARAWITSRRALWAFHDDDWEAVNVGEVFSKIGVNTSADTTNRVSVKSNGVLFSHDDVTPGTGDARVMINRSGSTKSAHLQFATNWVVSAEAGLVGSDSLALKVSPDGSAFSTALAINTTTGKIGINTSPGSQRLLIREDQVGMTNFTVTNLQDDSAASSGLTLSTFGSQYFIFQLYRSGAMYAYTNAAMTIGTYADKPLALRTNTTDRVTIHGDGRVSVGTGIASAMLAVNGAARVGSYAKASLPSASTNGAGAMIYVTDATGGSVVAFSDGADWRRVTDRTVIN